MACDYLIMKPTFYTDIFDRYFKEKFWGNKDGSSGPNSAFSETYLLRENLNKLLNKLEIESLFDAGCGDANLIKHLNLPMLKQYIGAECSESLTRQNQENYKDKDNFEFINFDLLENPIPSVDLILCRDVVHYWPNEWINLFLENCQRSGSKYLLITHNTHSPLSANSPTEFGIFRPVNLVQKPFLWPEPIETIKEDIFAKELALFCMGK